MNLVELDGALRKALGPIYPRLAEMHLVDYKVRVINSEAATAAGCERVFSGSISPRAGLKRRWAMPVFARKLALSKMATPVVSLPVPAVVGMAISGFSAPGTGKPFPIGGLT